MPISKPTKLFSLLHLKKNNFLRNANKMEWNRHESLLIIHSEH